MEHCNQIRLIYNTNKLLFKIEISAMVSLFMPQPSEELDNSPKQVSVRPLRDDGGDPCPLVRHNIVKNSRIIFK